MADDEEAFDAADVMRNVVRTKTVPPPTRRPSRLQALSMLAAVTAATISWKLAGVSSSTTGIYQFVSTRRPDYIDPSCVMQVFMYYPPTYPTVPKKKLVRVLHCRCPILGIGGTKADLEDAKYRNWPVHAHHIEDKDDLSLAAFCHFQVNHAIGYIP